MLEKETIDELDKPSAATFEGAITVAFIVGDLSP